MKQTETLRNDIWIFGNFFFLLFLTHRAHKSLAHLHSVYELSIIFEPIQVAQNSFFFSANCMQFIVEYDKK